MIHRLLPLMGILLVGIAQAQPYGIPERVPNTELIISTPPPPEASEYTVERIFAAVNPGSGHTIPTLGEIPDGSGRLYAVIQSGRIVAFPNKPHDLLSSEIVTLLDISSQVCQNVEAGMYDLVFHPDYLNNGYIFVSYVYENGRCFVSNPSAPLRISRFTVTDFETFEVNPDSEVVVIQVPQRSNIHKGGALEFGPHDGLLYISTGDGATPASAQETTNLTGNILRLDVTSPPESGLNYAIPADNPFVDGGPAGTATRREIYAYGFRNPWKMSFHPITNELWVGDVGQVAYEEMSIIEAGGNYGWPAYEGPLCYNSTLCATLDIEETVLPITGYSRISGIPNAINAGFVWQSNRLPELVGRHIFSDYGGWIGVIDQDSGTGEYSWSMLMAPGPHTFAGMGSDFSGEVYLTQGYLRPVHIYRIVRSTPPDDEIITEVPEKLSDFPALFAAGAGEGHTVPGVIPYRPNAQLWSDGALKERYMAIPHDYPAAYSQEGAWAFPNGTVLVKNFLLPMDDRDPEGTAKRVETRVMYRHEGEWQGVTYAWDEDEQDATLVYGSAKRPFNRIDHDGFPYGYEWYYPSRNDCRVCHTVPAGEVLGISSAQLNGLYTYPESGVTANQFDTLVSIGVVEPSPPVSSATLEHTIPDYTNPGFSLDERVRAYFHANCAMCHLPNGTTNSEIDLRWYADDMNAIGVEPLRETLGLEDPQIVYPGKPDRSVLYERVSRLDGARMPPLATSKLDEDALKMIRDWILQMETTSTDNMWRHYH